MIELPDNKKYKPFQTCNKTGFFDGLSVINTPYKGEPSENSLMFAGEPEKAIRKAFDISILSFSDSFVEACSGDVNEKRRITTLHSSSLLSLLFFHSVSINNPITICGRQFTAKRFEHPNHITPGHCSNIDVRLTDTDRAFTLFLESKYSEYLDNGKYSGISSEVYLDYYNDQNLHSALERIGLTVKETGSESFDLCAPSGRTLHYAGGIKQMISHWVGALIYANEHKKETVWLGEIVYDFGMEQAVTLERYKKDYSALVEGLNNSKYKPDNLFVLPELMTYQQLRHSNPDYKIPARIEEFYNLKL